MTSKKLVEDFLSEKNIAVVGVSRTGKGFGYTAYKELRSKGYNVYSVNPNAHDIEGEKCYPSLLALQGKVDAAVLVVKDAHSAGIKKIWMQQGSESDEAIVFCEESGIDVIHNECILMFAEPSAFIHRAHKWVWGVIGKLPR